MAGEWANTWAFEMVTPAKLPKRKPATPDNGCIIGVVIVVAILILASLGKCSSPTETSGNTTATTQMTQTLSAAVAAQTAPPVERLSRASVARGIAHGRMALKAEGISGAMIYSQNCYDALSRKFTWAKLDTCGAFDMLAVQALPEADVVGLEKETAYFQSEVTAGRYLASATGAGEASQEADTRLSTLQAKVGSPRALAPPKEDVDEANRDIRSEDTEADPSNLFTSED